MIVTAPIATSRYLLLVVFLVTGAGVRAQKSPENTPETPQPARRLKLDTIKVEGFRPKDVKIIIDHKGANPLLLDVRTAEEFATGHLKGAINIPLMQLEKRLPSLRKYKSRTIITMCDKGVKGMQACGILVANRIGWTYYMKTGIDGWVKEGLPLDK